MKRVDVYAYHTMILIGTDFIIGSYPCFKLIFFNRDSINSTEGV